MGIAASRRRRVAAVRVLLDNMGVPNKDDEAAQELGQAHRFDEDDDD